MMFSGKGSPGRSNSMYKGRKARKSLAYLRDSKFSASQPLAVHKARG